MEEKRTITPIGKVRLSSEKHLLSVCPTVSYAAAWLLPYPYRHPVFADKWEKVLKGTLAARNFFSMADEKPPEGLQKLESFVLGRFTEFAEDS